MHLKTIQISVVDNGYVVTVTTDGVQSVYDKDTVLIVPDQNKLLDLIKEKTDV